MGEKITCKYIATYVCALRVRVMLQKKKKKYGDINKGCKQHGTQYDVYDT